ncbi:MAG: MFS transporter [Hyphomicrobiaceae bacterium]
MTIESTVVPIDGTAAASDSDDKVGKLGIVSWVLFELAQQPFYSVITTFLFGPFFANYFIGDPLRGQNTWLAMAAVMGLLVAVLSPVLGAMADASGRRKPWVLLASLCMAAGMATLWLAEPGRMEFFWLVAAAYVIAGLAAELNGAFVNAIMPKLVQPVHFGRLSGISAAVAYLGGLTALILMTAFIAVDATTGKTLLGLEPLLKLDVTRFESDRIVGPLIALWFVVFALPFFLFTPDPRTPTASSTPVRDGLRALRQTARDIRQYGSAATFLIARMLYQDGLGGMFALAGIYGIQLFGWRTVDSGLFGIVLILCAMIGAALASVIESRLGAKALIMICLLIAILGAIGVVSITAEHVLFVIPVAAKVAGSGFMSSAGEWVFLVSAILVGVVAGPLNSSSRSLMARLSPPEKLAQFFGFYAFSGKATSFLAPILIVLLTSATGDTRMGVVVVLAFLYHGLILMPFVRVAK